MGLPLARRLRLAAALLALAAQPLAARDFTRIILLLGGDEAQGSPQASETRMTEVPLGTHPAEMWKQVPFAFAGKHSHSISSGTCLDHTTTPTTHPPLTEPRSWWQTLTRQPTFDPQRSHWGAEIGLGRDLYDRGYRDFRIIKYTRNGGLADDAFKAFMNDLLAYPAYDRPSFYHHAFELAAVVYFQKAKPGTGDWDGSSAPLEIYRSLKAALPQTRHLKFFAVADPTNLTAALGLRQGLYQLAPPKGTGTQEELENINIVPISDLPRQATGHLSAEGLMQLGQRLAHQLVLCRALRPPEAKSAITHYPDKRMVREYFVDEKGQPKLQGGAWRQIDYHYASGRVSKMVFVGEETATLTFTYSGENTLDQVYDPLTKAPLYLSAAGDYFGPNGLPLSLPMLPAKIATFNGVGHCASSPLSPWLWFAMTHDLRSTDPDTTPEEAARLADRPLDSIVAVAKFSGVLEEQDCPLQIGSQPPGPWPPEKTLPDYASAAKRGSFEAFYSFKLGCCGCPCDARLSPLRVKLPPITKPEPMANFFDPTLACLPTPVGLRRTYEGSQPPPAYLAEPNAMPRFLTRKLEYQQAQCPSLQPTSRITALTAPDAKPAALPPATHTGMFVPFPMATAQYLERLSLPPAQARPRQTATLKIVYEPLKSPRVALGLRQVPVEFSYSGAGLRPFAAKWLEHDEAGRLVRETYLDAANHPAPGPDGWSMKANLFSAEGLLLQTSYLDCHRRLCYNTDGYAEVVHTYNTHRQLLSTEYFSPQGMLTPHLKLGYSAAGLSYRLGGEQVLEKTYFNSNNRPARQKWGYASIKFAYDRSGLLESIHFADENGEPCAHLAGHFGVSYSYGSNRLVETEWCLDAKDKSLMTAYGYAGITYRYDDQDRLLTTHYLAAAGGSCTAINGCSQSAREYSEKGLLTAEEYLGTATRAVRMPFGWTRKENIYNEDSHLIEEKFLGPGGIPVAIDTGYCRIVHGYDSAGNPTGEAFYGPQGKLVLGPGRYAVMKHRLADDGHHGTRRTDTFFRGHGGTESIANADGFARVSYQYDSLHRCQREDYFDVDGVPGAKPPAVVSSALEYDACGRESRREYRSGKDALRIGPEGWCSRSLAYDLLGRTTDTAYRDCAGKASGTDNHYARLARDYFSDGVSFQEFYFADAAIPANSSQGVPSRSLVYQPGRDGVPPSFLEQFLAGAKSVANRFGYAGRSFQLDEQGQLMREIFLDETQRPTANSLGYKGVRFEGLKGVFARSLADEVTRPDGNSSVELTPLGELSYSARAPEGFRRRTTTTVASGALSRLAYETPEQTHYHPFRDYQCRACGKQRSELPSPLILGPDRFATETVLYAKDEEISATPMPGFTNIWHVYADATGTPVMNRWGYMRADMEFDNLGQLISESFFDTANEPAITTAGYSKADYRYEKGYLLDKTFITDPAASAAEPQEARVPGSVAQKITERLQQRFNPAPPVPKAP